ncbi:hypothetical protein [Xenorhabdus bovienii]|uniref:hypothetical protein n=1 Tax=Xenorhabdus bovienii TaxID=40576 RepID=UPI0023B29F9F|nr:hypothetical protein [Xenorhabdus bovienii]MDE9536523.1 hypothetical protein [Xenorhabdus bovienii]MDE9589624.1 hypothetical protein [Xenorhabdus bovienii]
MNNKEDKNVSVYHLYGGDPKYPGAMIGNGHTVDSSGSLINIRPSVVWSSNVYMNEYVLFESEEERKYTIYESQSVIATSSSVTLSLSKTLLIPWGFSGGILNDFIFISIESSTNTSNEILTLVPPGKTSQNNQPSKFFRWPEIIKGKTYRLIRGDIYSMGYYEAMDSVDNKTAVTQGQTVRFKKQKVEPPMLV